MNYNLGRRKGTDWFVEDIELVNAFVILSDFFVML